MKILNVFAAAAIAASGMGGMAMAQGTPQAVPAEFPPSSFTGRQYVDSSGCVFIRAGIDNNVTWVPRLTRGRQQVCGFQPSLSASTIASVRAPRATAAPEPTTPAPTPTTVRTAAPAPTPRIVRTTTPAPAPATVAAVPAAPAPTTTVVRKTAVSSVPSACSNRSDRAQQYLSSRRNDIRCGPQTQPHVTFTDGPPSPNATVYTFRGHSQATSGQVRVAPKHVREDQIVSTQGIFVPKGYQPVWDDDRLNPKRAHQTLAGKAQMEQIWTKSVPRDVKPGVIAGSHVSIAAGGVPDDVQPQVSRASTVTSAASLATDTSKPSHRYVQIGAFSDAAKAKRAAQRLANSGLPTKMGAHRQSGTSYTLVVVGPFQTQAGLDGGLARVRGLGYAQATLKR